MELFCLFYVHMLYNETMELKEMIREYKIRSGRSDADIARQIGVDRSTVARWASGSVRKVSGDVMERLSAMIGYNVEPILKGMEISIRLPVLGYVRAGYNLFAEENYLGEEEVSLEDRRRADYYLKVEGDSMSGIGIMDGSLVLVRQCSRLESGEIGVILVGEEVTVKRVVLKKGMMILEAANPHVENRYFSAGEIKDLPVKILGKVISCKTYY